MRLGLGDYGHPDRQQFVARSLFWETANRVTPEPFREFEAIALDDTPVSEAVAGWCERWALTDDWIREDAAFTLRFLREPTIPDEIAPTGEGSIAHGLALGIAGPVDPETSVYAAARLSGWVRHRPVPAIAWDPETETEAAFLERVREYVAERKAQAEAAGLERNPEKRMAPLRHFEWAARYQFERLSFNAIAALPGSGADRKGISHGVHAVADLIGLTLRPARGGRPRKGGS